MSHSLADCEQKAVFVEKVYGTNSCWLYALRRPSRNEEFVRKRPCIVILGKLFSSPIRTMQRASFVQMPPMEIGFLVRNYKRSLRIVYCMTRF